MCLLPGSHNLINHGLRAQVQGCEYDDGITELLQSSIWLAGEANVKSASKWYFKE